MTRGIRLHIILQTSSSKSVSHLGKPWARARHAFVQASPLLKWVYPTISSTVRSRSAERRVYRRNPAIAVSVDIRDGVIQSDKSGATPACQPPPCRSYYLITTYQRTFRVLSQPTQGYAQRVSPVQTSTAATSLRDVRVSWPGLAHASIRPAPAWLMVSELLVSKRATRQFFDEALYISVLI